MIQYRVDDRRAVDGMIFHNLPGLWKGMVKTMVGVYFSGTGNTKHCTEKLVHLLDETAQALPIEGEEAVEALSRQDFIILAYPVQYSNVPVIVRDFIKSHGALWKNKKVFCVATMALFSGDGAGCSARLLKKYGAEVVGGLHVLMPDSICDVKLLKRSVEKNRRVIRAADRKIEKCAEEIRQGHYPRNGLHFCDRIAGLIGQRLWFYQKTKKYSDQLKISDACMGCGQCARLCPMGNLTLKDSRASAGSRCTMCYRCISACPAQAITLLGDRVVEQCPYDRYVSGEDICQGIAAGVLQMSDQSIYCGGDRWEEERRSPEAYTGKR